jgi:hypothetical protein
MQLARQFMPYNNKKSIIQKNRNYFLSMIVDCFVVLRTPRNDGGRGIAALRSQLWKKRRNSK